MATLLLRLVAPMQAWGTTSRFDERDSQLEPSKSGVLGLICAALGRDRADPITDIAALRMAVRVDREGFLLRDYQTATGVLMAVGKPAMNRTVVSPRYYLADAAFLVALEGETRLLEKIQQAMQAPAWPLALGRKSMPPSLPVWLPDGLQHAPMLEVLKCYPRIAKPQRGYSDQALRLMIEHPSEGAARLDQPIAPFAERRFGPRFVKMEMLDVSDKATA